MDADLKRRWVEALRSGQYQQGRKWLRRAGHHCCLGVFCEVVDPAGWDREGLASAHHGSETSPLGPTNDRYGLSLDQINALITLNDDQGSTFAQIADYIEENL